MKDLQFSPLKWQEIAGERVFIEKVGESYFAYGSETACKRLVNGLGFGMAEYSPRKDKWLFTTYSDQDSLTIMSTQLSEIDLTRVNNDVNGNPRYVVHFLSLLSHSEQNPELATPAMNTAQVIRYLYDKSETEYMYEKALKKARKIGGKKFHNKRYGGGIVFQSYNTDELKKDILKLRDGSPL